MLRPAVVDNVLSFVQHQMSTKTGAQPLPLLKSVRVLDQLRERIRSLHYSLRTEQVYVYWVRRFVGFHAVVHPAKLDGPEVEAFCLGSRTIAG